MRSTDEGGMGEVYRARDPRLGRDVEIKALPDLSVADSERVARFQREAQILAALNHPHIAALYGDDLHLRAAATEKWVDLENHAQEARPGSPPSLGGVGVLVKACPDPTSRARRSAP
jgi:hypothetical protein